MMFDIPAYTKSKYTNAYIEVAKELALKVDIISAEFSFCRISSSVTELEIQNCHLGCNDITSTMLANNKQLSLRNFAAHQVPVPEFETFESEDGFKKESDIDALFDYAQAHYPLVLKPIQGFGGRGVFANITNDDQLAFALAGIQGLRARRILAESHEPGQHYRVQFFAGEALKVLQRIPANVTGNGQDEIARLIDEKNIRRADNGMPQIRLNAKLKHVLYKQGLTLTDTPRSGEVVWLSDVSNYDAGGDVKIIDLAGIPDANIQELRRAAAVTGLTLVGIDVICMDITRPFAETRWVINEANSHPAIVYRYPGFTREQYLDLPSKILKRHFQIADTSSA